jgi:polyisoprenoid-binding protein YceI
MRRRAGQIAVLASVLLSACAPPISQLPPVAGRVPADFPEQAYRQAAAHGRRVYRVDAASSLITIDVYRAGSLARLGHDHVVASHDAQGYVLPDAGNADLYVELDRLVVDEPALRAEAHFDTQPSPEDIAGTRRNMLGSGVLDAARYPFARIHVAGVGSTGDPPTASVSIKLHGKTRQLQ